MAGCEPVFININERVNDKTHERPPCSSAGTILEQWGWGSGALPASVSQWLQIAPRTIKMLRRTKGNRKETWLDGSHEATKLTISVLATLHPKVPAPSSRHLTDMTLSKSKEGISRQCMSLRFRSTDDSASLEQG